MAGIIDFLQGGVNKYQQDQSQKQAFDRMIQQELAKQKIAQQNQRINPNEILSQLELQNIVRQLQQGGQLGQQPQIPPQQAQRPAQPVPQQSPNRLRLPEGGLFGAQQPPQQQAIPQGGIGQIRPPQAQQQPLGAIQRAQPQQRVPQQYQQIPGTTKTNQYGLPETTFKTVETPEFKLSQKRKEGEIATSQQVKTQEQKETAKRIRDSRTATSKVGIKFKSWLQTVGRTMDLTGIPPGPLQAPLNKVLGKTKFNEFYEAYKGMEPEYGAAIARIAMPGIRSGSSIFLFQKGAPNDWSTIKSGVRNSAASAKSAFVTYLSTEEGAKELEKETGVAYSPINPTPWNNAALKKANEFENLYMDNLNAMVYEENPRLLDKQTKQIFDRQLQMEINKRRNKGGRNARF